jgi:hypothetical protein
MADGVAAETATGARRVSEIRSGRRHTVGIGFHEAA